MGEVSAKTNKQFFREIFLVLIGNIFSNINNCKKLNIYFNDFKLCGLMPQMSPKKISRKNLNLNVQKVEKRDFPIWLCAI